MLDKLKNFQWLHHFVVPILFLLIAFLFHHTRARFELSVDEGVNLMKAFLVEKGYALYDEIWSDQPPLLTYVLAFGMRLFGYKVGVARNLVFLFSLGMLWAGYEWMGLVWKKPHAFMACLLIFLSPAYLTTSFAPIVGLPSISLAMVSLLCLALWHEKRRSVWLILSALLLSLAVFTKLMIGFLAPIFVVGIFLDDVVRFRTAKRWQDLLLPTGLWSVIFIALVLVGLFSLVGTENFSQLLGDHLSATADAFYAADPTLKINYHLREAWHLLFLAGLGTWFAILSRRWVTLYLTAWAIFAYVLLLFHTPVWATHLLYVTIPASMLGGIAIIEGVTLLTSPQPERSPKIMKGLRIVALMGTLYFGLLLPKTEPFQVLQWPPSLETTGLEVGARVERILGKMVEFAPQTTWIVTDLPMYAFRARLPVPPELAVMTDKRLRTGYLTDEEVLEIVIQYQPEQVLLGRFILPSLDAYLETHYQTVAKKDEIKLYIRNDLLP